MCVFVCEMVLPLMCYQTRHLSTGFILEPAGHLKALENSSELAKVPMTLWMGWFKLKRLMPNTFQVCLPVLSRRVHRSP